MAVQKKQSVIPPSRGPLSSHTIDNQRKANRFERTKEAGGNVKPNSLAKKTVSQSVPVSPRANAAANGQNIDERLRAARERREEHQKLLESRELSRQEREKRARRYHEQQLLERKRKLLEHRLKEENRRAAVEEKRKQRLKEEKERHESAVRKTLEKSQRASQNLNQRGRKLTKYIPRRIPLTSWEKNLVSRLLTPTCSYLARSKSAGCQTGEEVSFHSMSAASSATPPKPPSNRRPPTSPSPSPSPVSPGASKNQQRSVNLAQIKAARQQDASKKKSKTTNNSNSRSPTVKPSVKAPAVTPSRTASPSPNRSPRRSLSRHSTPLQLELPSVPEEDMSVCLPVLSPGNSRPVRTSAEGRLEKMEISAAETPKPAPPQAATRTAGDGSPSKVPTPSGPPAFSVAPALPAPQPPEVVSRPSAGTTDPEEASRLLAEKRREARLQREREEQERLQREEAERRSREELERRRSEERARQQAEAQRLIEEKRRREEEEQRRAEEERAQAMREAALLQKQREEEQARERAKAEQQQKEREIQAQKEEAERQVRKKRLEEIMRRTRRTESPDTKSVPARIPTDESKPKENTQPPHNGAIEDAVKLPVGSRLNANEGDVVPVVAFKERRSLRTLTGLEEIQTHQRAEVI